MKLRDAQAGWVLSWHIEDDPGLLPISRLHHRTFTLTGFLVPEALPSGRGEGVGTSGAVAAKPGIASTAATRVETD